jgi:hypothetical protein
LEQIYQITVYKLFFLMLGSADAPGCTAACRLVVQPKILDFQLAPPGVLHVTMAPMILAVKGGTIGREMASKFGLKVVS